MRPSFCIFLYDVIFYFSYNLHFFFLSTTAREELRCLSNLIGLCLVIKQFYNTVLYFSRMCSKNIRKNIVFILVKTWDCQKNSLVNFLVMFQKFVFMFSVFITFLTLHLHNSAYSNAATKTCPQKSYFCLAFC